MSAESYIIDGGRSPIGLKNGEMVGVRSDDLTSMVIKGLMERNSNIAPEEIEELLPRTIRQEPNPFIEDLERRMKEMASEKET